MNRNYPQKFLTRNKVLLFKLEFWTFAKTVNLKFDQVLDRYYKKEVAVFLTFNKWSRDSRLAQLVNKIDDSIKSDESEAKKIMEKLNRAQKCSILGPQNLGSRGGQGPGARGPLDPHLCEEN